MRRHLEAELAVEVRREPGGAGVVGCVCCICRCCCRGGRWTCAWSERGGSDEHEVRMLLGLATKRTREDVSEAGCVSKKPSNRTNEGAEVGIEALGGMRGKHDDQSRRGASEHGLACWPPGRFGARAGLGSGAKG